MFLTFRTINLTTAQLRSRAGEPESTREVRWTSNGSLLARAIARDLVWARRRRCRTHIAGVLESLRRRRHWSVGLPA
jgi:hypothetical protein